MKDKIYFRDLEPGTIVEVKERTSGKTSFFEFVKLEPYGVYCYRLTKSLDYDKRSMMNNGNPKRCKVHGEIVKIVKEPKREGSR